VKKRILEVLRGRQEPVSGERLSEVLGTSRVSVWKHVRALQALGYGIEATRRGYRLKSTPDALFPWEFGGREDRIHYLEEADSTMTRAAGLARNGCPPMTVVIAERQTGGRGRLKRTWDSPPGGLYFTLVLRPAVSPLLSARITFYTAAVLVEVLRRRYHIDAMVKWPNDILVGGRKLCGMLSEMEAETDLIAFLNVGVGINANNDTAAHRDIAVSLRELLGRTVSRRALLEDFLETFEGGFSAAASEESVTRWKRHATTLNREVEVATTRETFSGLARDVDENGALIIEMADGSRRRVLFGDCFHRS
jgi:BirA family biotin operon repressor/biotin-[acetyl-CoA-carboxylase] ligase